MIHNNKVYANADEKFVKGTIVYGDWSTGKLYYDEAHEKPVISTELLDLYLNGMIVYTYSSGLGCYSYITITLYSDGCVYGDEPQGSLKSFEATAPTE